MNNLMRVSLFSKSIYSGNNLLLISVIMIGIGITSCDKPDNPGNNTSKPKPTPDFSFTGGGCTAPCQVVFQNNSSDATSYSWDFGDGTTSTLANPTKTYNVGGAYTVTLTATGEGGTAAISKQIAIGNAKVIADFSFTGGGCTAPCQVVFVNTSQNATAYSWNFGDGTTSTAANPSKTYNLGGTFTVTLTATGAGGTAAISKQIVIIPRAVGAISTSTITFLMWQPGGTLGLLYPPSCTQTFGLTNIGPTGSKLNYKIVPSETPFVTFTNGTGSLQAGQSATITVDLDKTSSFYTSGYFERNMFLKIYNTADSTPGALPILLEEIWFKPVAPALIGTWLGTWSGNSYGRNNPGQAAPASPVNGTWLINLQTVDLTNMSASGTLTWRGQDKYWVYTYSNGNISTATPQTFIPDRTIPFNSLNTTFSFTYNGPGSPCSYRLRINGAHLAPNPSDAFYGPRIDIDLNINSKTVSSTNVGFSNSPYNPANFDTGLSTGVVTGSKQ